MTSKLNTTTRSRTKRGLPRPCQACGQDFRPKHNKARFCGEACKKAQARLEAKTGLACDPDTYVARVPFRSKSANNINGVSDHIRKPRICAKSGWHIEAGELVFHTSPGTSALTAGERRRLSRGHMRVAA